MTTTSSHLNATDIPVPIEAYAPFVYQGETFQTYYKIFGDLTGHAVVPLIVVHGGPGLSHDYLLPHADLAAHRPVVFYDQIGNGRSTRLPDKPREFWTIDLFLDEFDSLVAHLGIQDAYHIVGHSWGGMMAAELVVRRHPASLKRLVVTNSPAAIDLWNKSLQQILGTFPKEVQDPVVKGESADPDGFFAAMLKVYAVHGLRIQPFPDEFLKTFGYQYGSNADKTVSNAGCVAFRVPTFRFVVRVLIQFALQDFEWLDGRGAPTQCERPDSDDQREVRHRARLCDGGLS